MPNKKTEWSTKMKEPPGDTLGRFFYRLWKGNRSKNERKTPENLQKCKKSARQFYQNHRADLVSVEHCVKLGVYARRVVNKTSHSESEVAGDRTCATRSSRIVKKRQIIADFCRLLLALLTSRRKNRHLEGFYLLTLPPQDRFLCFSSAK